MPTGTQRRTPATAARARLGWSELHPQLDHYQTLDAADGTCTPTGDTGEWHAASGQLRRLAGVVDQPGSATPGQTVEISIAYVTDWAVQNLGVFVDDVTLPDGTSTSFETGLERLDGHRAADGQWAEREQLDRAPDASGFPVGASITHPELAA